MSSQNDPSNKGGETGGGDRPGESGNKPGLGHEEGDEPGKQGSQGGGGGEEPKTASKGINPVQHSE